MDFNTVLMLGAAAVAGVLLLSLAGPKRQQVVSGVVLDQALSQGSTYRQTLTGPGGAVRQGPAIESPPAWIVSVRLDGGERVMRARVPNLRDSPPYAPGERVRLLLVQRGFPPMRKTFVQAIERATP